MNWKYAIGEVALVVVGILLALAASAWYEGLQERREELIVLDELRAALATDRDNLAVARDSFRLAE